MSPSLVYHPYEFAVHRNPYGTYRRIGGHTVDRDDRVRPRGGKVSGWKRLPISFRPWSRLGTVAA